jgi:D-lactate dehydrogenase
MRKLLTPHVRAIGRPAGPAQHDAVDPAGVEGTLAALKNDLIRLVGQDQVLHRVSDLVRYASDASPYRYLAQVVVLARTVDDVRRSWRTAPVPGGTPRSARAAPA